jgi:hypothetical protein
MHLTSPICLIGLMYPVCQNFPPSLTNPTCLIRESARNLPILLIVASDARSAAVKGSAAAVRRRSLAMGRSLNVPIGLELVRAPFKCLRTHLQIGRPLSRCYRPNCFCCRGVSLRVGAVGGCCRHQSVGTEALVRIHFLGCSLLETRLPLVVVFC